jgi:YbbR domain-containing protein
VTPQPPAEGVRWPVALWRLARVSLNTMIRTLPLGLLSLSLALVIWATVTNEENPAVRRTIPGDISVEQVNVPRNLLPTDVMPARVAVTITGPRSAVNDVRPQDVVAQVDLDRADEEMAGQREATIERPVKVEVRRRTVRGEATPGFVRVTIERQERRTVPVCIERVDVPPPGFTIEEPIVSDPAEVTISGPRRNIDAVECAAAVVRLGSTVSVSSQVPLEPRDAAGRPIGSVTLQPTTATLAIRVKQNLFPREVAIDPQLNGRPAPGYSVAALRTDPATVNVVGPLDVVNSLISVPTEPIDIEGARSDVIRSVSLQIPPGVSSGERRTVVTIVVQVTRGPGSVAATPRIVNLGAGLTATLDTPSVAVLVSGPAPDVLALRPADVTVTVDAAGLGPGAHRLEPHVTVPSGITFDGTAPDRVEITVR